MYFQAHVHNYERMSPIYRNESIYDDGITMSAYENPKATTYLVVGAAGNSAEHNDPLSSTP